MHNLSSNYLFLSLIALICLLGACEADPGPIEKGDNNFPDFSSCNCDFTERAIVCTSDGKWFRSPCFAACAGYNILFDERDSCLNSPPDPLDTLSWPITLWCHPIEPLPPVSKVLSDSTVIFQMDGPDSSLVRAIPFFTCLCLPGETPIATPQGNRAVSDLLIGDSVLTQNLNGEIELQAIISRNSVTVPEDHQLLYLCLADGREIELSPGHPDVMGSSLFSLEIGQELDGAKIMQKELRPFGGKATWDILPAGQTGVYQANGIWIGSTLKQNPL